MSAVTSQTNLLKGTIQQLTKQQLVTQQQHKINLGRNQLLLNDNKLQPCKTSKSKMKQNMNDNSTYRPTLMTTHCRE